MLTMMIQLPNFSKVFSIRPDSKLARPVPHSPQKVYVKCNEHNIVRRQGNYGPTIWQFEHIQSLKTNNEGENYSKRYNQLKEDVRMILKEEQDRLSQLENIDTIQRLGLSYQFEDEIKEILAAIYPIKESDLYGTSLEFRLFRQYGYLVPSDIYNTFKDHTGNFIEKLAEHTKGLLALHEATFYILPGEVILEEARTFAKNNLQKYVGISGNNINKNDYLGKLVRHELEFPRSWRMKRLEARWFVDLYGTSYKKINPKFLELAKYDYNFVQSIYLEEIKHLSRWWNNTKLAQKLKFSRDRVFENFLWSAEGQFEPKFSYYRGILTKCGLLVGFVDDIYDIYGTLDELKLFQDALERWDINDIDHLPEYMRLCYFAVFNSINEFAYDVLKEQDLLITKYLKKSWVDLCKSYMVEANWFYSGYTPTLKEYVENGTISISFPLLLVHTYFAITNQITEEEINYLMEYPSLVRKVSLICRLANDLGTSSAELERGDIPKSVQCYMHETGACEEEAREHIKHLINELWNELNEERYQKSLFSHTFVESALEVVKAAMCLYKNGDGHGIDPKGETEEVILTLYIHPILLEPEPLG